MNTIENKNSYFLLKLTLPNEFKDSDKFINKVNMATDEILYSMSALVNDPENYHIEHKKHKEIIHIFRTNNRKRAGQLNKFCKRFIKENWEVKIETSGIKKEEVPEIIQKIKNNKNYIITGNIYNNIYDGTDIQIFKDRKNWRPWQKDVYDMIFEEPNNYKKIKTPDSRTVIHLVDNKGNSGKSSFWKFLYTRNKKDIGRLGYGTSGQLRSAAINLGPKKVYIIDLSRTQGIYDNTTDLISVVEDIKSGFILSPMYGNGKELLIEPPHTILSTNKLFDKNYMSMDRWKTYEIKHKSFKLGKENNLFKIESQKKIIKKSRTILRTHLQKC